MDFKEFVGMVKDNIRTYLPESYEDKSINIRSYKKINNHYVGMTFVGGVENVLPVVNLNEAFQNFINGKNFIEVMEDIAHAFEMDTHEFHVESLIDFEQAKERLFVVLCGVEDNKNFLDTVPHTIVEDMALTYHLVARSNSEDILSTPITNTLMELYGVDKETVHQAALISSERLFPVQMEGLNEFLTKTFIEDMQAIGKPEEEIDALLYGIDMSNEMNITILSNDVRIEGASVLFYPDTMDQIAERVGGDYYLLPSSIHEFLIVPNEGLLSYEDLLNMVTDANALVVRPEEKLTDQVYHYDPVEKVFEIASKYENRMKEKEYAVDQKLEGSILKDLNNKKTQVTATDFGTKKQSRNTEMAI